MYEYRVEVPFMDGGIQSYDAMAIITARGGAREIYFDSMQIESIYGTNIYTGKEREFKSPYLYRVGYDDKAINWESVAEKLNEALYD